MATLLHESQIAWARPRVATYPSGEALALEGELKKRIEGEVRFDAGSRALYATDGSNYRQVPIGVVVPKTDRRCPASPSNSARRFGAPLLARGGGTSLAGQCCNVAVVLDFTKYLNKLIDLDPQAKTARVQPGIVLDWLRKEAERHQLTFGPDPSTHNHNTLGGMIGNNSCGTHSVMAGKTEENVIELDILTYDGLRMHVGGTPDDEYRRIVSEGGRRGEIYARLEATRRAARGRDPAPFSEHSAPRVRLQSPGPPARERVQCGALAGRHRMHLRRYPRSDGKTGLEPARPVAGGPGLPRHLSGRPITSLKSSSSSRSPARRSMPCSSRT